MENLEYLAFILVISFLTLYLIAYIIIFYKRYKKTKIVRNRTPYSFKELIQSIFPNFKSAEAESISKNLASNLFNEDELREKKKIIDTLSVLSAVGETVWFGVDALFKLSYVNKHIYDAISHLARKQLDTIGDLKSHLSNWDHDFWGNLKEGALNNLKGHVSEFIVAEHLRQLGHEVEIPDISNQAGYDLIVDGVPVNVKNVADMSSIYEHFEKYPDIPVIVNYDLGGNLDNALIIDPTSGLDQLDNFEFLNHDDLIITDVGLDNDAVLNHVTNATEAIDGNFDFHFPFITLALSSFREIKLLINNHTEIITAAKNIALDVIGTGFGGFTGAQIGSFIGNLIFPGIGAILGGVAGGFLGAIGGRMITNNIKYQNFYEAKAKYENSISDYSTKAEEVNRIANKRFEECVLNEERKLKDFAEQERKKIENLKSSIIEKIEKDLTLDDRNLLRLYHKANQILWDEIKRIDSRIRSISFIKKYLWPSDEIICLIKTRRKTISEIKSMSKIKQRLFFSNKKLSQNFKTTTSLELFSKLGLFREEIYEHLINYKKQVDNYFNLLNSNIENARIELSRKRYEAFKRISDELEKIRLWAQKQIEPFIEKIKQTQNELLIEMRKLGLLETK